MDGSLHIPTLAETVENIPLHIKALKTCGAKNDPAKMKKLL